MRNGRKTPGMTSTNSPGDRQSAFAEMSKGLAAALLLVAAATLTGLPIAQRWGIGPVVLLYIPAVLAAAVYAGLWPALLAGVAATLSYNYFFTAPYRTFVIHSPADAVTATMLFIVALVTSRLAGSLRDQARHAAGHAARNATIAGLARKLLACTGEEQIAQIVVTELAQLFGCHTVLLTRGESPRLLASVPAEASLAPSDLAAAAVTLATGGPAGRGVRRLNLADWQFRPVASERGILAAAGMAREDGLPPVREDQVALLDNLLDQVALALERARLEHEARDSAALRERDKLRSALLASIGEDVKPRINAISAAVRALKREGTSDKTDLASIAEEAARLDRFIDNLVDLAPGEEQTPIQLGPLTIDFRRRTVQREGQPVELTPKEYAVLVELAKQPGRVLSHAHLLRAVWGPAHEGQIDYLRAAIGALRRKLEPDPARPSLILNQPAVGYRLAAA